MSATRESRFDDPEQRIADLERQLAGCRAERDEALARETATAEVGGHQFLARRPRAGVRRDAGKGDAAVRGQLRRHSHL